MNEDNRMDDLISRQAAIDTLERKKNKNAKGDIGGFYNKIIQNDIDALMQLPSAQPEQKRGKWEEKYIENAEPLFHRRFYCSACGRWQTYGKTEYCPKCGARMDGDTA